MGEAPEAYALRKGKREPDGPTLRLLEVAEQYPEVFLKKVHLRHEGMRTYSEEP